MMKRCILLLLLINLPFLLAASDYAFFGEGSLRGSYTGEADAAQGELRLYGDHSLYYSWGEAHLRHRLVLIPGLGGEISSTEHDIFQASVHWYPSDSLSLLFGRHQLGWGMGYAFFPSDAFHPERSPEGDVPGFDGFSCSYSMGPDLNLSAAVRLDEAIASDGVAAEELRYALQCSSFFGGLDLSTSLVYKVDEILRPGLGASYQLFGSIINIDAAVEFLYGGIDYSALAGTGISEPAEPRLLISSGIERSFFGDRTSLRLLAEYLYDGSGLQRGEREALYASLLSQDPLSSYPSFGRHFIYPMISFNYDGRITLASSALVNLEEQSASFKHSISWAQGDGLEFYLEAGWNLSGRGANEAALALDQGQNWTIGMETRLYF